MGITTYPQAVIPAGLIMASARSDAPSGWLLCDGQLISRATYSDLYAAIGFQYSPTPGTDPGGNNFYLPNLKGKVIVQRDAAQAEFDVLGESGGSKTHTLTTAEMPQHNHTVTVNDNNFNTDSRNTDHAHNVYARNQDTDWMNQNAAHWHTAHIASIKYLAGEQPHDHGGGAGWTAEAPNRQTGTAATVPVNVDNRDTNHKHNFNHDHPSTNWQSEAPWNNGHTHLHNANHGHSASSGNAGSTGAHNNLQPYITMNYLIKT